MADPARARKLADRIKVIIAKRLERGLREPRLRTAMQVAAALRVPVQDLIAPPEVVPEPEPVG